MTVGKSEYALRLFPLLCGIAAVLLFVRVAQAFLAPDVVPVAVLLFAAADAPIYYASEVKQYSTDVAATLALIVLGLALRGAVSNRSRVLIALSGIALVWLSHPAVFTMLGVGLALALTAAWQREWPAPAAARAGPRDLAGRARGRSARRPAHPGAARGEGHVCRLVERRRGRRHGQGVRGCFRPA